MDENLLKISSVQEGNKQLFEIKLSKIPTFGKILLVPFAIGAIVFIVGVFVLFPSLPIFFKVGIPIMILLFFFVMFLAGSQLKNMALVLSKDGDKLYIRKVFSKGKATEKTITLLQNAKFVLVKFPISIFYYQLLLENNGVLEILVPVEWDVVQKFPFINPHMKKFLYTENDAQQIAKLIDIPLEISDKNFNEYIEGFKK